MKHIQRWVEQVNYTGKNFDGYYVAAMRFFRCTPVERSNYEYAQNILSDVGASPGQVLFPKFTDESMLCRYYILVRDDFEKGLSVADMLAARVKRKGSLDPDREDEINERGVRTQWERSELYGRMLLCRDAGVSVFAARNEKFPYTHRDAAKLYELLTEKI